MAALELKNSYALRDYRMAMANYNAGQCVNAIHHIREFDAKSKGINSTHDEYSLLGELMFYIMTDNGNNI